MYYKKKGFWSKKSNFKDYFRVYIYLWHVSLKTDITSIPGYLRCRTAKGSKWFIGPYGLPSSGLGVLSSSLARLTYSHGIPRESTLSSRPACGMSVGLCSDVKLVSRQSRCGGVPARAPNWYLVGLDGDSRARISCSCNSSSWTSVAWCSRAASDDASVEDGSRCGFAGPRVVTTWSRREPRRRGIVVSLVTECRETTGTNHIRESLEIGSPSTDVSLSYHPF